MANIQTAEQMVAALKQATAGQGTYAYTPQQLTELSNPTLKSAQELASLYGFDYNKDNIFNTYKKSLDAGYAAKYNQQAQSDAKYYDNAAVAQSTLADTLRQQQSQAILSGANKGMQAANALSTLLGTSQQFAASATQLAMDRGQIAKDYATDSANMGVKALDTYNALGNQLADISKNVYSSDTSKYVGQLDYNSGVNTANAQMAAQQMSAQAQYQSALTNSISNIYQQYYSGQISLQTAEKQAQASIQAAKVYGVDAANISANANKAVAATNLKAAQSSAYSGSTGSDSATKAATANMLTSVIAGANAGTLTVAEAKNQLSGFKAMGLIDEATYKRTLALVNPTKPKTTDTNKSKAAPTKTTGMDPAIKAALTPGGSPSSILNWFK